MKTIKLLPLIISASMLAACSSTPHPKYKISDADTQRWIEKGNQVEQCVFAKEYRQKNFNTLSQEEQFLHNRGVYENTLIDTIGLANAQLLMSDPASKQYLSQQYQKFNHANPTTFDQNWCNAQKQNYQQALKQVRAEMKKQQAEETARKQQEEKERKAQEAFYSSKEGQAYLAQQQLLAQQQKMQQQQAILQQQHYQQMAAIQSRNDTLSLMNSVNNSLANAANSMQQRANAMTQMATSMPVYQYTPQQRSTTTCHTLPGGIVRCNHQ